MENNEGSSVIRPTLKLSRCSRKPRKRIGAQNSELPVKKQRKKRSWKSMDDIPIPSFSPVHDLNKLDLSVLDSPVKKEAKKEVKDVFEFRDTDDDDDDDELLNGPPTFAPSQKMSATKKTKTKERKIVENQSPIARKASRGAETTDDTKLDANDHQLPDETIQTIETLIQQLEDPSQVTLKKLVNLVAKELDCTVDKEMRRLIRDHVRSLMDKEDVTNDVKHDAPVQDSATAQGSKEITSSSITAKKRATIQPEEDDLIVSIDHWFAQADAKQATCKQFYEVLEVQYGAKLHKRSKAIVKARLKGLLNGTIEPTVSPERVTESSDSQDTAALLEEAAAATGTVERNELNMEDYDGGDIAMLMDDADDEPTRTDDTKELLASTTDAQKEADDDGFGKGKRSAPASPEETAVKPPAKRRGRSSKEAKSVEVIVVDDESASNAAHTAGLNPTVQATEKPVPKRKKAAPRKPRGPRAKKGTCVLCTTCSCTIGKETNANDTPAPNMSRTDAEIERALLRRTKKLENIIDKYQGMLDHVNRELKKHRRAIWKKEEAQLNDGRRLAFGDSRFLPDADVWDEQAEAATHLDALSPTIVQEAQETVFGVGNCQITLTQMFGGCGSKDKGEDNDANVDANEGNQEVNIAVADDQCSQTVSAEDKDEEDLDAEGPADEFEPEPEPADRIHRLAWRKGGKVEGHSSLLRGSGAWNALTTNAPENSLVDIKPSSPQTAASMTQGTDSSLMPTPPTRTDTYSCAWDALFSDGFSEDDEGLDQLLDLFESEMCDDEPDGRGDEGTPDAFSQQSAFETPLLSQRGESVVNAIEEEITSDPPRLQSIEAVCPKWRDNIRYALAHRGPAEIRQALDRARRSMTNLKRTEEKVSLVWQRQRVVLELFESSLSASLSRLTTVDDSSDESDERCLAVQQNKETTVLSPIMEGNEDVTQPSQ